MNASDMSEFMRKLMKRQIICLQKRLEEEKMTRAVENMGEA